MVNLALSSLYLILVIAGMLGLGLLLLRFLMDRAIRQVIKAFREKEALDPEHAKTKSELGLKSASQAKLVGGFFKPRDYKPYVFDSMVQLNIIRSTEDDRYYLSEQTLKSSNLSKFA